MKTIFKDDTLMIKTKQLIALAPLFKIIIERYLDLGQHIGYSKGQGDLQDNIKELLGIGG